jgi:DnaJ-class molecular chaperone
LTEQFADAHDERLMEFKHYYAVLGVTQDASVDDIKRAYRRLARKYHPDVSKESDAEVRFKKVGEAYAVLKDEEKRATYDRLGSNWKAGQEFHPPPDWSSQFGESQPDVGAFSEFFEALFGAHGPQADAQAGRRSAFQRIVRRRSRSRRRGLTLAQSIICSATCISTWPARRLRSICLKKSGR